MIAKIRPSLYLEPLSPANIQRHSAEICLKEAKTHYKIHYTHNNSHVDVRLIGDSFLRDEFE